LQYCEEPDQLVPPSHEYWYAGVPPLTGTLLIQPVLCPQGAGVILALPITGKGFTVTVAIALAVHVPLAPVSVYVVVVFGLTEIDPVFEFPGLQV
jgi:hypothetical protein